MERVQRGCTLFGFAARRLPVLDKTPSVLVCGSERLKLRHQERHYRFGYSYKSTQGTAPRQEQKHPEKRGTEDKSDVSDSVSKVGKALIIEKLQKIARKGDMVRSREGEQQTLKTDITGSAKRPQLARDTAHPREKKRKKEKKGRLGRDRLGNWQQWMHRQAGDISLVYGQWTDPFVVIDKPAGSYPML